MDPARKPATKIMQSRSVKSIRFTDEEWAEIAADARALGIEPSKHARICALTGCRLRPGLEAVEAYRRHAAAESV